MAEPSTAPTISTDPHDKTIEKIQKEISKIVKTASRDDMLNNHRLLDHAHLLHKPSVYLISIGNRKFLCVCSKCSLHEVVVMQTDTSTFYRKCQKQISSQKQLEKRREEHKQIKVNPKGKFPLTSLKPDKLK